MTVHGGDQDICIPGPDDVELLISPSVDGYFWRIRNGGLKKVEQVRLELSSVLTFDERKGAFREPVGVGFPWPVLGLIPAGDLTQADAFLSAEGDRLRVWNSIKSPFLPWPSGDPNPRRQWLLKLRVTGLSEHWPIELELQWTVGSKTLELRQYPLPHGGRSEQSTKDGDSTLPQQRESMKKWAEIEAKKYGDKAMETIQAANLNLRDFAQEPCPPSFRIVHLRTPDFFAFGGETGGANWSRPGVPGRPQQTGRGNRESWEAKFRHFEGWVLDLQEFLAARDGPSTRDRTAPSLIVPESQTALAEASRSAMPLFVTSSQVTVVRNAGDTEETRWVARVGGNMVSQVLFYAEDRPKTGDEIYSELFDEPRVITRVDPVLMNTGVSHWDASIIPKSEWIRRHPGQGRPEATPPNAAVMPKRLPTDGPLDDETLPQGDLDPLEVARGRVRSAWVDAKRGGKKWTSDVDIQNNGGPTYNTIQRYRSGRKSTHDPGVRLKFSTAFGCDLAEVPE